MSASKPAYRVPLLSEIVKVPHNGLNVVSTFAGCGGSSTGYRMSGYRVLAAVEFVPAAADTYEANMAPYTKMLRRDVRQLDAKELLDACGLKPGELDVFDGSPPCEPFSTAGKRDKTWNHEVEYSGQHQRTDDLFYEYARLVKGMQPRCFVAENVTGLVRGRAKGYFMRIMQALRDCGYTVNARILDASWLGVPQARKRVIIIGVRSDLDRQPVFPTPLTYQYTVRDALGDLLNRGDIVRMGSFSHYHNPRDITDQPGWTVVAGDSVHWHVDETAGRRRLTIPELKRICGFPDDYVLTGSFSQQWERLGDAVPPPMAAAWAKALAAGPLNQEKQEKSDVQD